MGIEPESSYSPRVLARIIYSAARAVSFEQARRDLEELSEVRISTKHVQRLAERIGAERVAEREAEVRHWEELDLPRRRESPREQAPELAVVQMDGGRIQIFDRAAARETESSSGNHWRETKVGCLMTMQSATFTDDPCPQIPDGFIDAGAMVKLTREIGHNVSWEGDSPPPTPGPSEENRERLGVPRVLVRSLAASMACSRDFGAKLAAAAWERGFAAANRKAFLADGAAANWTVWRTYFSHYVPIVDFIHALAYVFAAAMAGRKLDEGWLVHRRWGQWLWAGEVAKILPELEMRLGELGKPTDDDGEQHPRTIVAECLTYLRNQQSRMHYDQYRRQGLPITTAHMESAVKQVSRRVKGTEKFWSGRGAEAMLQLRADYLSETQPMPAFWKARSLQATGHRHYHQIQGA